MLADDEAGGGCRTGRRVATGAKFSLSTTAPRAASSKYQNLPVPNPTRGPRMMVKSSSLTLMATALALATASAPAQLSTPLDSAALAAFRWRPIGPVHMGGRITDIEAVPSNPS